MHKKLEIPISIKMATVLPIPTVAMSSSTDLSKDMTCMKNILKFLPHEDILKIRTMNKFCNRLFQQSEILDRTQFIMDGTSQKTGHDSLQAFLDSKVLWTNITFRNFETEKGLFSLVPLFYIFTRKFGPTIKSLTYENAKAGLARVVELFVHLPKLEELTVENTPSFFETSVEIFGLAKSFEAFNQRISRLKTLRFIEDESEIFNKYSGDLELLSTTKDLKVLQFHTSDSRDSVFSARGVCQSVYNSRSTLLELDLKGRYPNRFQRNQNGTEDIWINISNYAPKQLTKLIIHRLSVENLHCLLQKLENLQSLQLYRVNDFSSDVFLGTFPKLRELVFHNCCDLKTGFLRYFTQSSKLKRIILEENELSSDNDNEVDDIVDEYTKFLDNITSDGLEEIAIKYVKLEDNAKILVPDLMNLLALAVARSKGRLQKLCIENFSGLSDVQKIIPLLGLRKELKYLSFEGTDFNDSCCYVLGELAGLETLNLRGTSITELGLAKIAKIKSLKTIKIRETNVDLKKLSIIFADNSNVNVVASDDTDESSEDGESRAESLDSDDLIDFAVAAAYEIYEEEDRLDELADLENQS